MIKIKKRNKIIENGKTPRIQECRRIALDCIEYVINAVDPKKLVKRSLNIENGFIEIDSFSFELKRFRDVYVVGGGKASGAMAQALEEIIGNYLTAGEVNIPYGLCHKTRIIKLNKANHPIPDQSSIEGALRIMELAARAGKDDLVINLISGGGSSLMEVPLEGITLEDQRVTTDFLLRSGASISEMNVVRKHLSAFKGGRLAKEAFPATVVNLILSDVLGDPLDSIASGPTVPDTSTFIEAKQVLEKYNLWLSVPCSVRKVLSSGIAGQVEETPKADNEAFQKVYTKIIGNNRIATLAAADYLNSKRINTLLIAENLLGEARYMGRSIASFAGALCDSKFVSKPSAAVIGGETTVTVKGKGIGGRNQELALAAAIHLREDKECVIASFSTDGIDGPTNAAGAIVDNCTLESAKVAGLNPYKTLADNNSYNFFYGLGDLVITGQTGTNVNDLAVVICPQQ